MEVKAISEIKIVPPSKTLTYKDSGVDIDEGNEFVNKIVPHAKGTFRSGTLSGLGGFGGLFDIKAAGYKDPILVSTTDGVGTKLLIAQDANSHDSIGVDLVAMCVNDLIVQSAEPLFFLDYLATGKLDSIAAEKLVKGIADGCRQAGCSLIGGETAEMPGLYLPGHYDLAGFAVGAVERQALLPRNDIQVKDAIIGLESNGLHSNGFSLVRKIIKEAGLNLDEAAPFDKNASLSEVLLQPTRIYVNSCLTTIKMGNIKALAHITGGGLIENVPRVLPNGLGAVFYSRTWYMPPVFKWLSEAGKVAPDEMFRTFNCGIGMVVIVSEEKASVTVDYLKNHGETAKLIGEIVKVTAEEPRIRIQDINSKNL